MPSKIDKSLVRASRQFRDVCDGEGYSLRASLIGRLLSQLEAVMPAGPQLDANKRVFKTECNRTVDDFQTTYFGRLRNIAADTNDDQAVQEIDEFLAGIGEKRDYYAARRQQGTHGASSENLSGDPRANGAG